MEFPHIGAESSISDKPPLHLEKVSYTYRTSAYRYIAKTLRIHAYTQRRKYLLEKRIKIWRHRNNYLSRGANLTPTP